MKTQKLRQNLHSMLILTALLCAATGLGYLFRYAGFPETNIVIVYILSTLITARFTGGYVYGIVASIAATCAFNFFFIEPYFSFTFYDPSYLITFAIMTITAIVTSTLTSKAAKNALEAKERGMHADFLRSISHDLRTPLTGISGNAKVLMNNAETLSADKRYEIYSDIYDDSVWMSGLIENLLSITRIENNKSGLNIQPELISEVIEEALTRITRDSTSRKISVNIADEFLMAAMDARLVVQVFVNMIDNAVKFTRYGSEIVITARRDGDNVRIEIADNGFGIGDESKKKIFGMFYTEDKAGRDGRRGLGLGLYLCKAIITAHGGEIYVRDNKPRGAVFGFTLKAEETKAYE